MSPITTHILDTARGTPAAGVRVTLSRWRPEGESQVLDRQETDADGRLRSLGQGPLALGASLEPGVYELTFDVGPYFEKHGSPNFFPSVRIAFHLDKPEAHYHVPLLISPFGYSTYRGS